MRFPLVMLLGSVLIGCTSVSEQAMLAQSGEWYKIGLLDGQQGHYQRARTELIALNELGDAGVQQYKQGYVQGISEYCLPDNAYEQGDRGIRYRGQCANTEFEDLAVKKWQSAYEDALAMEAMYFEYSD